jgi:hypothetical protein
MTIGELWGKHSSDQKVKRIGGNELYNGQHPRKIKIPNQTFKETKKECRS